MKKLTVQPSLENIGMVTDFVEETLSASACPMKIIIKMNIAVDELFSNIARYSGASETEISCGVENGTAVLQFIDNGKEYDPTTQAEPDITLPSGEREIGGLGIFMVKKTMDSVQYEYKDQRNRLTVQKNLEK